MGMSASQARFLSLTARLSDIEGTQQNIAYAKQRLSDNSSYINDQYLEALNKTKYQVITGYNASEANYADVSYAQLTGTQNISNGKQYLVKDNKGKVVVSKEIAEAFSKYNGDYNKFLMALGYTQSNIDLNSNASIDKIHEAWDMYLASVGKSADYYDNGKHILAFDFQATGEGILNGYPVYNTVSLIQTDEDGEITKSIELFKDKEGYYRENKEIISITNDKEIECGFYSEELDKNNNPIKIWNKLEGVHFNTETNKYTFSEFKNENGILTEYDKLYFDPELIDEDGNITISEEMNNYNVELPNFKRVSESDVLNFEGTTVAQRELYDYALAITEQFYNSKRDNTNFNTTPSLKYDANIVNYYKNIFDEMRSNGYTTIADSFNISESTASQNMKDSGWFVKQLKAGKLSLSYFSAAEKSFIGTSLDDDESITEKEDKAAIKIAEQTYKSAMDNLQAKDKQYDLQLNRLEAEHNAVQTELESVQKVLKNNVEKSFKTFEG